MADIQSEQPIINTVKVPARRGMNLWKFIAVILIILLIGVFAYEAGKGQLTFLNKYMPSTVTTQTKMTPTITSVATKNSPTPTPTAAVGGKTVSAGKKTQIFSPYKITIPSGWTDTLTTNSVSDTLTITKGQYILTISQAAGGTGSCLYPGDAQQPMAQAFTNFVGITGTFSQFKRGTSDNTSYTVCEQKSSGFSYPTSVGYITYEVPAQADQAMLSQMDGMVASLTK